MFDSLPRPIRQLVSCRKTVLWRDAGQYNRRNRTMTRRQFIVLLASPLVPARLAAQERAWRQAIWAAEQPQGLAAIETTADIVTARPSDADGTAWIGKPGDPVRYVREGTTLHLLDAENREHTLQVVESAPKYSVEYAAIGGGHYITSVASGGTAVTLEDGSRWDIDPRQHFAVAGWSPDDLITIRRSTDDPAFAFEIDNTTQDDGALANRRVR